MSLVRIPARALQPGDELSPTGRVVLRVVHDGLYERGYDDQWLIPKRRWPKGKVEVVLNDGHGPRYWGSRTFVTVTR